MDTHLKRLLVACNFICGLPAEVEEPEDMAVVLPYLAVPAALLAVVTLLVLGFCAQALSPLGATLIATVVLGVLWLMVSRGQNLLALGTLVRGLEGDWRGRATDEASELSVHQIVVFCMLLVKVAGLAILVYQGAWRWLALVPLASVFYAMEMSSLLGYVSAESPQLGPSRLVAVVIFMLLSLVAGFRGVFVMVFLWLVCRALANWARGRDAALWQPLVNGGTEAAECVILLLGLVFLT